MEARAKPVIRIDLTQFKLHIRLKPKTEVTLHFDSSSRRFYLSVIALVLSEMKRLGQITSIPLEAHAEQLALLNETVGDSAGSSENLMHRIYRKWKDALPDLENAPLFKVMGRKKNQEDGPGKTYRFTDAEKDAWANLFEYKGSEEHVRLRFSIDTLGASLDDAGILYENARNGDAWERFIAGLTPKPVPETAIPTPKVPSPLLPPAKKGNIGKFLPHRRAVLIAILAVVVGIASFTLWHAYGRVNNRASVERMTFPLPDKPSIAVLPFVNMSKDPDEDYFCDGMTDQIITSLSIVPRLFVIARDSTFVYKGKAVKVQKVAEDLGVRYVLEGSVQKSQDRIRVLVQLIDAIKGVHLWSERYDKDLKDIFALQDEITRGVMTSLQVKLTEGDFASGIAGTTSNLKALECFWRAEERFFKFSKEDNAAARTWAEKAIELDPNFAGAWAVLGFIHFSDAMFGYVKTPSQSIKLAEECGQKAISINYACAKGHGCLARTRNIQGRYDEAVEHAEKALAVNPNDPGMMVILATVIQSVGRFDESIALLKKAMRVCPYYPAFWLDRIALAYLSTGHYQEVIEACELMLDRSRKGEVNPFFANLYLAEAYAGLGQIGKARAQAEEVLKIKPSFSMEGERLLAAYKDPVYKERHFALLRQAGLK
ncbi:MAG: tetratricopeptide repeat protein [Syntrophorhabdales bacterium]|jgi:TolB-like protein